MVNMERYVFLHWLLFADVQEIDQANRKPNQQDFESFVDKRNLENVE
jgi:hypothetical protein